MATVGDLALEVAALLNDAESGYEFIRWTEAELIEYANDGAAQVASLRPDDFASSQELTLQPGARQTLPNDATHFYRVDGTLDQYGGVVGMPSATDYGATRIAASYFDDLACAACRSGAYTVRSFSFDPTSSRSFFVDPPVPAGKPVKIMVTYAAALARAQADDPLPLPERYHNAVIEWMLYRAFSKDTESASAASHAQEHFGAFNTLVAASQQVDDRYDRNGGMNVRTR
ncbi:hypothetical protein AWB76_03283 [Caballeronia temeraria]|uniref:Uncharacterized protein n=1 Tax=Caballeronia temeraria TaxID=1777137 RepID=A0A158AXS7_9BURK|nr:DUF6682 family protein [Caballeronia temeraria]SAK62632.1 hypothetical protein AWB76_03283 [Caballeronia temeraria]